MRIRIQRSELVHLCQISLPQSELELVGASPVVHHVQSGQGSF